MTNELMFGLYARKSTRGEEKQQHSIGDQISAMSEVGEKDELNIATTIYDKRSAKLAGRPGFNELIRLIEGGKINAILTWKLDRLARNFDDGGKIISLLQQGKIQQIRTFEKIYLPSDNVLMIALELGMANQYSRDIAFNTGRHIREKVKRGEFPHIAPFGYLNDLRTKLIVIDKEKAPMVREAFTRYADGDETLDTLRSLFKARGFVSKSEKVVGRHFVSRMLTNPIYYGDFKHAGTVYAGIHEPIISKALFDRVQIIMADRWRYPAQQHSTSKAFLGLL